jgi:CO dehydrogenase maturation factor
MTTTIALAGKGGTGKTTVAALLIRYLMEERSGAILAIDADPASNLHFVLGMELHQTIGEIREDMLEQVQTSGALAGSMPGGMSKQEYLDYQVQMSLVEGEQVDLLAMGRPEGQGCYCAANQMLRLILDRLKSNYDYVVIDNEAGMEHLSRRTTRDVDVLLLVTDPTQRGLITAKRMQEMVPELEIGVGHVYLILNRLRGTGSKGAGRDGAGPVPSPLAKAIEEADLELIGTLPEESAMPEFEFTGRPLVELPRDTELYQAVRSVADEILRNGRR